MQIHTHLFDVCVCVCVCVVCVAVSEQSMCSQSAWQYMLCPIRLFNTL